ncbi:uncharacterized protein LOC129854126 [Salvelinus fontinalis]|uniref:uncharacterized protein LOC129854126 n=1 Tax=Salvelinus fontinalis TaxID=8038 RepID=UPI00248607CD|nr:uncharacterized protein LOC129854126 [Salvelinus fontinalis]
MMKLQKTRKNLKKTHKTIPEKSVTKRKKPMRLSDALIRCKRPLNDSHDVSVIQQLTTELQQYGGLWDSVKIIDKQLASLCKESKYSAVVCQLQFRRFVLGMKNERGIFNTSVEGRKLSLEKLVSNLKRNVSTVVKATEEPQPVLVNASEQGPQSVDRVLIERNSVREREPKLSRAEGSRNGGRCKTQKNEVMNDGEDQLKNCSRTSQKQVEMQSGMNKNEVLADEALNCEMLERMDQPTTTAQESCSVYFEFDCPYGASALKKAGSTKVGGKQDNTHRCSILFSVDGNSLSDNRIPVVSHSEQLLGKRVKQALDGNIEFFSGTVVKMKEENGVNLFQVKYDDLCIDWWIDLWKEYEQKNVLVLPIDFGSIIGKKVEQRVAIDDGQETWRVGDLSFSAKGDTQYAV